MKYLEQVFKIIKCVVLEKYLPEHLPKFQKYSSIISVTVHITQK